MKYCELCFEVDMKSIFYKEYDGLLLCKECYLEAKQDKAIQLLD